MKIKMKESSKRAKCQCGKTKDPNGNCDGSHANTNLDEINQVLTSYKNY